MVEPVVGADDQRWALTPDDHALVLNKHRANQLGFAIMGRVRSRAAGDRGAKPAAQRRGSGGRRGISHRTNRRALSACAPRFAPGLDSEKLRSRMRNANRMVTRPRRGRSRRRNRVDDRAARNTIRELAMEPPTADRMVRTALRTHEERFHADIYGRLSSAIRERLDKLRPAEGDSDSSSPDDMAGSAPAVLLKLRYNPGRPSVASMQEELAKLVSGPATAQI
jgi:hypothetical protein